MEGIEDEAEDLQRHDAKQGLHIARLSEDDRRVVGRIIAMWPAGTE